MNTDTTSSFVPAVRRALSMIAAAALLFAIPLHHLPAQQHARFKSAAIDLHRHTTATLPSAGVAAAATAFRDWKESNAVLARFTELRSAKHLSVTQILAYRDLKAAHPDVRIWWDETGTLPIAIDGGILQASAETFTGGATTEAALRATARSFFSAFHALLRSDPSGNDFVPTGTPLADERSVTLRLEQKYRGISVAGGQACINFDARGNVVHFQGRIFPTPSFDPSIAPVVLPAQAIDHATRWISARGALMSDMDARIQGLLAYTGPQARMVAYTDSVGTPAHPAFEVTVRPNSRDRWIVFVDARDGSVLRGYNATCADGPEQATATDLNGRQQTINTYLKNGIHYMIDASRPMYNAAASVIPDNPQGAIVTLDARNTDLTSAYFVASSDNTWNDASSVSAHVNAAVTYEYYRTTHNWNSIDGHGENIISVVNVTSGGASMNNAYWNGNLMVYGNGGATFKPLAGGLDVAAHEMTHGVTERTASLQYLQQSGALNESFSDIFGAMVDRSNWTIGEDVVRPGPQFPSGALRDMQNPHNGATQGSPAWQPAHMSEYVTMPDAQDNGGVHLNSGIPNHAAYLLATAITREKAEKIFFRTLTTKLTTLSRFIDFRIGMIKSAEELYGAGSAEAAACASACDQVGILDGSGTKIPGDIPPVNGADQLLFVSTDPSDPYFLWMVAPPANPNDYRSLSGTPILRRPSISDDGSIAVFVDAGNMLRAIALNPAAPNEQVLDTNGIWYSVAISRDKNLIALTTVLNDPVIYVLDLSTPIPAMRDFTIVTPDYSGSGLPSLAQFVDAMDFSSDNESLLFDVYNELTVNGQTKGFWEINLLDVYDKSAGTFGDGKVLRVFPTQPDVSLGNPTWARNKPTVFAFDVQDDADQASAIFAMDLVARQPKMISPLHYTEPGYPTYRGDDRVISFGATPLFGAAGIDSVYNVPVAADGVTATSVPRPFIPAAIFPIWFRQGSRPTAVESAAPAPSTPIVLRNWPNPFNPSTSISATIPANGDVEIAVLDGLGRTVRILYSGWHEAGTFSTTWNGTDTRGRALPSGVYYCRARTGGSVAVTSMVMIK